MWQPSQGSTNSHIRCHTKKTFGLLCVESVIFESPKLGSGGSRSCNTSATTLPLLLRAASKYVETKWCGWWDVLQWFLEFLICLDWFLLDYWARVLHMTISVFIPPFDISSFKRVNCFFCFPFQLILVHGWVKLCRKLGVWMMFSMQYCSNAVLNNILIAVLHWHLWQCVQFQLETRGQ